MKMIGIIDEFGIESFMPLEGHLKEAFFFIIRSKLNIQKNVIFFCLDFTEKEINKIRNLTESHEVKLFNEAGIIVIGKLDSQNKASTKTDKLLSRFYQLRARFK